MPKIIVVRPDMTEEEREKRVKEFENTLSGLLKCKVSLKSKSREFIPYNIQREVYYIIDIFLKFSVYTDFKTIIPLAFCFKIFYAFNNAF